MVFSAHQFARDLLFPGVALLACSCTTSRRSLSSSIQSHTLRVSKCSGNVSSSLSKVGPIVFFSFYSSPSPCLGASLLLSRHVLLSLSPPLSLAPSPPSLPFPAVSLPPLSFPSLLQTDLQMVLCNLGLPLQEVVQGNVHGVAGTNQLLLFARVFVRVRVCVCFSCGYSVCAVQSVASCAYRHIHRPDLQCLGQLILVSKTLVCVCIFCARVLV